VQPFLALRACRYENSSTAYVLVMFGRCPVIYFRNPVDPCLQTPQLSLSACGEHQLLLTMTAGARHDW
jgi:hypothetical protein